MKCPACWAEKAYRRADGGPWTVLLRCLLFVPMRCRHCYHKFWVHRALALGQVLDPPPKKQAAPPPDKASVAAQYVSQKSQEGQQDKDVRRRAA